MADQDLESQVSSQSSGALPRVEVGVTMSEAKRSLWERKFGQTPYTTRPGKYHSHGMLAAQRFVAERYACEKLLENADVVVMDVGAAPHRTSRWLGDRGWYVMPRVLPGDAARISSAPPATRDRICHCRIESCTHVGAAAALLLVHSGYYVDPVAFWSLLNDERVRECIVVEHPFTDIAGGFYDEASWYFDGKLIHMNVKGQEQTPYVHQLPPWCSGWRGVGGEAFHAEVLESWDDVTRVVRVTPYLDSRPKGGVLMWDSVTAEDNLAGPVQFSAGTRAGVADNARLGRITFDFDRIYKFGPFLYTTSVLKGETVSIVVPINGVARVAARAANRERTPALYQELTYITQQAYQRSRLPYGIAAQTIAAVVALGFVANLGVEVDLLHTVVDRFTWRMKAHSTLLGFGTLAVKRWYWLLGFLLAAVGIATLVDVFDDNGDVDIGFTVTAIVFVLLGFCCVCSVLPAHRAFTAWREQGWTQHVSDQDSPSAPLLGQGFTFTRNLPIPGSRYVRPVPDQTQGSLAVGATRESALPKTGTLVSGIVMDGMVPTALDATQEAELSAVTNRILLPRANPTPEALTVLGEYVVRDDILPPGTLDTTRVGLDVWLKGLKGKYPSDYIEKMRDLWTKHHGTVAPPAPTKGFLKIEKSATTTKVDSAKAVKPRLIQPPSDECKAVLGPLISQLQHMWAAYWNGDSSPIMYCSGYTNAAVGARVDAFIAACGGEANVEAWSMDNESYDATLNLHLQLMAFKMYERKGLPRWATTWLLATRPRGTTPNGVTYSPTRRWVFKPGERDLADGLVSLLKKYQFKSEVKENLAGDIVVEHEDFQMVSGRPDTNLTDSVVLGSLVDVVMRRHHDVPWLLLVCGDDGFLMLPRDGHHIFGEVKQFLVDCGLKPTGTVSPNRCEWEFCSRLFFFGVHPDTGVEQTVLGAKPFRGMARMGFNTTLPGAQNAAAAALSVRVDASHVPFLNAVAERTFEICRDTRIRPTGRPEWSAMKPDTIRWQVSDKNYLLTQERYGLGREAEQELKSLLLTLERVPAVLSWLPALDAIRVDEA